MTATTTQQNGTTRHEPTTSTALARHEETTIQPANFAELRALAKDAAASRFYGAASPEQAFLLMMTGKDLGLSYTQALRAFHVIEGRPALSADGMVAVCLSHPDVCEYFRTIEATPQRAVVATKRVGCPERTQAFTIEEAKDAGLVKEKSGWAKWPARMCLARARSFLARDVYPDLLMGLYDPDELRDSAEEPRRVASVPVAPSSSPVAVDVTTAARSFEEAIGRAATPAEMKAISQAIADANLGEVDVAHLKAVYQARVAELKKAGAK